MQVGASACTAGLAQRLRGPRPTRA